MNARVLIVDDSLTVRMDLQSIFTAAGFETTLCKDLASARKALAEAPALVVLDLQLPDGDGLSFLAEIKAAPRTADLPVILLSTEAEVTDRIRGLATGADDYAGKPYDPRYIVTRAQALLARQGKHPAREKPCVLVIDDSPTFRDALETLFAANGYQVLAADSGEAGLSLAARERPDVVVVDGSLPGINGPTVIRRLRSDASLRRLPCMMLTASEGIGDELDALEAGADAYLRKGSADGILLARVAAMLRSTSEPSADARGSQLFGPLKILAISRDSGFVQSLGKTLMDEAFDLTLAGSAQQALALLAHQSVDGILLDRELPGPSAELCRSLQADPRWQNIPVIFLAASDDQKAIIDALNAGADDYVVLDAGGDVLKGRLRAQLRRRHLEEENRRLREAHQRLLEHDRYKDEFLSVVSHELRTPLTSILGFASLLNNGFVGALSAEQGECVQEIGTNADRMLLLINDLLDFAKLKAGKLSIAPQPTRYAEVIESVLASLKPLQEQKALHIETAIAAPESVSLDSLRIGQVLTNLIGNAIKFTPAGGTIRIAVTQSDDAVITEIRDSGVGFAAEDAKRLFSAFRQLNMSSTRAAEGTGLGLVISKALIESHGGRIEAESPGPGQGATFRFTLPIRTSPAIATRPE
ncbi:MAG TPA: response regulator [Oscillatoriaceae cyanobacterium]